MTPFAAFIVTEQMDPPAPDVEPQPVQLMNLEVAFAVAVSVIAALVLYVSFEVHVVVVQPLGYAVTNAVPAPPVIVPPPPSGLACVTVSACLRAKVTVTVVSAASEPIVQVVAVGLGRVQLLLKPTSVEVASSGVAVIVTAA